MRAWELTENNNPPSKPITLRALHKMKTKMISDAQIEQERHAFMPCMYAMLLLKWLHHLSKAGWSLSNLVAMLRMNLFTYRDLKAWLDRPFETPPAIPIDEQLTLALPGFGQP